MSALHYQYRGRGPDLVLVHGWGLHAGIWDGLLPRLERHYRVWCVDLPGHGTSPAAAAGREFNDWVDVLAKMPIESSARWIGWSLGGLLSIALALARPDLVERLVLVAGTPRFTQGPDWTDAMPPERLAQFAADLESDYRATLNRFLALQFDATGAGRTGLRAARASLFARGEPEPQALAAGLSFLAGVDLRPRLREIRSPVLVVHGDRDRLVPPAAARWLAGALPDGRLALMKRCGHAPFLSDPAAFIAAVHDFLLPAREDGRARAR